jgi:2-dehydropantoate 2-reductase
VKVAIIGSGALGGALGALLVDAGHDVLFVARPAQVAAIRRDGVSVTGCLGDRVIKAEAVPRLGDRSELALLAVKAHDAVDAIRQNLDCLTDVPLVTLQSGVRTPEQLAELLPAEQIVTGVPLVRATSSAPARVALIDRGSLLIGRLSRPRDVQINELGTILSSALPTRTSDNIRGAQWVKLIASLDNALSAVTNLSLGQVYADPYLSRLGVRLMREGVRVSNRLGVKLEALPELPLHLITAIDRLPVGIATRIIAPRVRRLEQKWPAPNSMLQSLHRRHPTEIAYLNGEIARAGGELGIPTPLNSGVVEIVLEVERTGSFYSPDRVRETLGDRVPR